VSVERVLADSVPGLRTSASEIDRISYARDLWPRHHIGVRDGELPSTRPAAIVWPESTEEVARIVAKCAAEGIPIAPFGAGSGVCGGTLPDARTVVLDLKRMSKVRKLSTEPRVIDVEAGAMGIRLEEDLVAQGHTLGHFPSSILCSTVGGWVAARSAGQCSGYYGKIEDMVVSLECVIGKGEIVKLYRRVSGPDLTPLIIGSEGILGVVTAAELRLHAAPTERSFGAFSFPTVEAGWEAMRTLFQAGVRPAVARLYDAFDSFMAKRGAVKKGSRKTGAAKTGPDLKSFALRTVLRAPTLMNGFIDAVGEKAFGGAMLVVVFEGDVERGRADLARVENIAERHGAKAMGEGPARHWFSHRYAVSYRQAPVFMAGAFSDTMEVAAPWSRLGELYHSVRRAMSRHVFVMAHLSHAYPDGCSIYFTFAGSAKGRAEAEKLYDATWNDAMDAVVAAGGTLSHHHGVGRSKAPKIARVIDPARIFNPGNLLPKGAVQRPRRELPHPAPDSPIFDDASLLLNASGESRLGLLEDLAQARGMSLRFPASARDQSLAAYLARGAHGAPDPWEDPVDHLLAGFSAKLKSGDTLTIPPGPRRAVGPDLYALFHGAGDRVGTVASAHLRLHRNGLSAQPLSTSLERDPSPSTGERELVERVHAAAAQASYGGSG
jgi:alkyldihydroxyacetonephosphate synthase